MPSVLLKWKDAARHKFGVLFDDTGAVRILTALELAALHSDPKAVPTGITRKQWESGLYSVAGYDHDKGEVEVEADGRRFVKYHHRIDGSRRFEQRVFHIPANVNINQNRLDRLDANRTQLTAFGAPADIVSIVNGVVTFTE